jgi:hypothetical protein
MLRRLVYFFLAYILGSLTAYFSCIFYTGRYGFSISEMLQEVVLLPYYQVFRLYGWSIIEGIANPYVLFLIGEFVILITISTLYFWKGNKFVLALIFLTCFFITFESTYFVWAVISV